MRITTLGDLLLDVIAHLDEEVVPGDDRMATTRVGAGGQAANVAAWAASLGAETRLVTKRGADAAGELVADELRGHGVEVVGPVDGRTGVVIAIAAAGDRTMVSDRGSAPALEPDELEPAWFRCDALHVSGYALLLEPAASAAARAVALAREAGAQVSLDLSSWTLIDDAFRDRVRALAPELVFAVEREREALGELDTRWVVKRGAAGVVVDGGCVPGAAGRRGRRDRRRGRVRGRVPGRRRRGGARGGGALLREAGGDAVIRDRRGGRGGARATAAAWWRSRRRSSRTASRRARASRSDWRRKRAVRESGSVPATVGVLDGEIVVGLSAGELGRFDESARKVGPRDVAAAAVQGATGATTVGGTLAVCNTTGIRFMGTGGLGGVHRGWPNPPDVSADLGALAQAPALVVSSGVKSLLDVPATAELLETLGVPVLGWQTDELPLFYAARGGPPVSARVESAKEAARIAAAHWELGGGGVLLGRPPEESLDDVEPLIEQALAEAETAGVRGQAVTPFVLAWLHRESGGRTLHANRELVIGNARLAGEVAAAATAPT